MRKEDKKRNTKNCNGSIAVVIMVFLTLFPGRVYAACEVAATAAPPLITWMTQSQTAITNFTTRMVEFLTEDFTTAQTEMITRLEEFQENITEWHALDWWPELKAVYQGMAHQYSIGVLAQSFNFGKFVDAEAQVLTQLEIQKKEREARHIFAPSEQACQADSQGRDTANAEFFSRALTNGVAQDAYARMMNRAGTVSEDGKAADIKSQWDIYTSYFCDPAMNAGYAGCTGGPTPLPNRDILMGDLLWGKRLTLDLSSAEGRMLMRQALTNIVDPVAFDPIPEAVLSNTTGQQAMLARRSMMARKQAVYNVLGRILATRVGAGRSMPGISDIRTAAGVNTANVSSRPSYREISEAMYQDRFRQTEWMLEVLNNPEKVKKMQADLRAGHLKQMRDIYKRFEELTFLMATELAFDLDQSRMLGNAAESAPNQ